MVATDRAPDKNKLGKDMSSIIVLALSNLIFALCLYLTWGIVSEMGWPIAAGIVDHTFIGTRKDPFSRYGKMVHSLNLAYTYEVDGKKYSNVSELEYSSSETDMLTKSHDFDSGKVISVRYNPKKPQNTYLTHKLAEAPLPVLVTVAAFCLLCALGALSTLVMSRFRKT